MPEFYSLEKEYYAIPSYEKIKLTILSKMDEITEKYEEIVKMIKEGFRDRELINEFISLVISLYNYIRPKMYCHPYKDFYSQFEGKTDEEKKQKYYEMLKKYDKYLFSPSTLTLKEAMDMYLKLSTYIEYLGVTRIEYISSITKRSGGITRIGDKLGD